MQEGWLQIKEFLKFHSYNPDEQGRSSGTSGADVERILAFHAIGKEDPVTYVKPWPEVLEDAINTENKHKEKI